MAPLLRDRAGTAALANRATHFALPTGEAARGGDTDRPSGFPGDGGGPGEAHGRPAGLSTFSQVRAVRDAELQRGSAVAVGLRAHEPAQIAVALRRRQAAGIAARPQIVAVREPLAGTEVASVRGRA